MRATAAGASAHAVIVGTLGSSPLVDELARAGKLDVKGLRGQWESFLITTVADPLPGVPLGAGRGRQRPEGDGLRRLRTLAGHRRLAVALVGGRRAGAQERSRRQGRRPPLRAAVGALPRRLPQRRGLGVAAVGGEDIRAGARRHRPQDLRAHLLAAAQAQGQHALARDAQVHAPLQPVRREQAGGGRLRRRHGFVARRADAAQQRRRVDGRPQALRLHAKPGGRPPLLGGARARERSLRERLHARHARHPRQPHPGAEDASRAHPPAGENLRRAARAARRSTPRRTFRRTGMSRRSRKSSAPTRRC